MNHPQHRVLSRVCGIAVLLAVAGLGSGCKTTFRTVDQRFISQPAKYRRVQVLPVWLLGAGNVDHSLTTNQLAALSRKAEAAVEAAVQAHLQAKCFELTSPVQVLRSNQMYVGSAAAIAQPLEAVRVDLSANPQWQHSAGGPDQPLCFRAAPKPSSARGEGGPAAVRARLEPNPFHYQMTPALTNVLAHLGATNADAVLLVETKAFFESENHCTKRVVYNCTGGGVLAVTEVGFNAALFLAAALAGSHSAPSVIWVDPFWHSCNSIQHTVALVDARTGEVLWLNRQSFRRQDPRDANVLSRTMATTLFDLPMLLGPSSPPAKPGSRQGEPGAAGTFADRAAGSSKAITTPVAGTK
jgi:hypothetical protein